MFGHKYKLELFFTFCEQYGLKKYNTFLLFFIYFLKNLKIQF